MKNRAIRVDGGFAYVPLTRGYEAVIDADDVPLVDGFNWYAQLSWFRSGTLRTVYAVRMQHRKCVFMHRAILAATEYTQVDHIDGNGMNNRRENIRTVTPGQNSQNQKLKSNNKTGVKGVMMDKARGKFRAEIRVNKEVFHLGRFDKIDDAAKAYAEASAKLHGEFGRLA